MTRGYSYRISQESGVPASTLNELGTPPGNGIYVREPRLSSLIGPRAAEVLASRRHQRTRPGVDASVGWAKGAQGDGPDRGRHLFPHAREGHGPAFLEAVKGCLLAGVLQHQVMPLVQALPKHVGVFQDLFEAESPCFRRIRSAVKSANNGVWESWTQSASNPAAS